jgi:hypothetical protein
LKGERDCLAGMSGSIYNDLQGFAGQCGALL